MSKVFSIEGNIASGKSTILTHLKKDWLVFEEPLEIWQTYNNVNWLQIMYREPKTYTVDFQIIALASFMERFLKNKYEQRILMERFPMSIEIFSTHAFENGFLSQTQYTAMTLLTKTLQKNRPLDGIVYLRTVPNVAYERLLKQARSEELQVTLSYLERLHELHDKHLLNREDVFVFNGDLKMNQREQELDRLEQ